MDHQRQEWISRRAHQLWEAASKPEGEHQEHWLQAEREYEARHGRPGEDVDGPIGSGANDASIASASGARI